MEASGCSRAAVRTLYEAKGLEFSDVLLYDFFKDSPTSTADWRVILNRVEPMDRSGVAAPRFDELRHTSVCSELKFLYVGLTRARNQLWIWDSSDRGEPMRVSNMAQFVIGFQLFQGPMECEESDRRPQTRRPYSRVGW
jgi:ATP-dependent exoDNAse (exonuclease V) beta subunit